MKQNVIIWSIVALVWGFIGVQSYHMYKRAKVVKLAKTEKDTAQIYGDSLDMLTIRLDSLYSFVKTLGPLTDKFKDSLFNVTRSYRDRNNYLYLKYRLFSEKYEILLNSAQNMKAWWFQNLFYDKSPKKEEITPTRSNKS